MYRYGLAMTEAEKVVLELFTARNYKGVVEYVLGLDVINSGFIRAIFNISKNQILWRK